MHAPPRLFDAGLLAQRRSRAAAQGPVDFLQAAVAAETSERLGEINRRFREPALIGPRPDIWLPELRPVVDGEIHSLPDAETLDLRPGAHDLIVHALALHWANDPVGQLVQMRRALRPDGLMLATLFAGDTLTELRAALAEAEIEALGGLSPRIAPMAEIRDLGGLLQRAGFALPVADSHRFDVSYAHILDLMHDLRGMGETNVLADRHRRFTPRALIGRAGAIYADAFGRPDGRLHATFEVVFLTGWAPSADQPQPLRPGSATSRLADALGTVERGTGDRAGGGD